MAENTEQLTIELHDTVRFSSECLIVRNVFLNWSSRNPEVQFCFPICSKACTHPCPEDRRYSAQQGAVP
jgi:hypothetical protein